MRFNTLQEWLQWQETLHPAEIELGLERVASVFARLQPEPPPFKVITVAGTNGKGSSVAMLESILLAAGYRVGCYTSPHILRYNERVKIGGIMVDDQQLCDAFARVDQGRGETSLTYFEFGTLAALDIFYRDNLDVVILEVGMGGRLDAVNILAPDVALITSVDIDHRDWLGDDRESIGREKAGIFRANTWAVCNDPRPPRSVIGMAAERDARLLCLGQDYHYDSSAQGWDWYYGNVQRLGLPLPALRGEIQLQNAAGVLMALYCLHDELPLSQNQIRDGLLNVSIAGRFQIIPGTITTIFDVAHNPEAIRSLAQNLGQQPCRGKTLAVFAALKDKDLEAMLQPLCPIIDAWFIAPLPTPRSATVGQLRDAIEASCQGAAITEAKDSRSGLAAAELVARDGDRIIVFGSFFTVAELLPFAV
jgi:dihydrofolate synthase/folylpolyglutamate synthase